MKAVATRDTPTPPPFVPVTLTITLESQEEVNALYQIGNWNTKVAKAVPKRDTTGCAGTTEQTIERVAYGFYVALTPYTDK